MSKVARVSSDKIRVLREAKRLTQHDLASTLRRRGFGTTQATVSRWEAGQLPHSSVLPVLAAELGVSVSELYGQADADEEPRAVPTLLETLYAELGAALSRERVSL